MNRRKARRLQHHIMAHLALALVVAQVLLSLVSWVLTAAVPERFVHSLLSDEGIRWFMGRFTSNMLSPLLVWLVLIVFACGSVERSGVLHYCSSEYRQRIAMRFALFIGVIFFLTMLVLTLAPHAILLNVMGRLFPSSFSESIVPYCCLAVVVMSIAFGLMTGRLHNVTAVYEAVVYGMRNLGGLLLLYILGMQLYCSVQFLMQ